MTDIGLVPTRDDLETVSRLRHIHTARMGWRPRMRRRFDYFTPDEYYEAMVARLVTPGCAWLDVGCGRAPFPDSAALAAVLSARCSRLVGIDLDDAVEQNTAVHERIRTSIEDFDTPQRFDVVTLRMVAEHLRSPRRAVAALSRLTRPAGFVIVYTVNRRSPVALLTSLTPFAIHHPVKRLLWGTEEEDTFPVVYRMNTRPALASLFTQGGFREAYFAYLDDCRVLSRFRATQLLELSLRSAVRACGLRYPETCLLGVYQRA
jgi:SAM-dependent methyltransferase